MHIYNTYICIYKWKKLRVLKRHGFQGHVGEWELENQVGSLHGTSSERSCCLTSAEN